MILVIEPNCRGAAHEQLNAGFVIALTRAFPSEEIRFVSHRSHGEAIRNVIATDADLPPKLSFERAVFDEIPGNRGVEAANHQFGRVFRASRGNHCTRVLILSFSAEQLVAIEQLADEPEFADLKMFAVLHGNFEALAQPLKNASKVVLPKASIPRSRLMRRIASFNLRQGWALIKRRINSVRLREPPLPIGEAIAHGAKKPITFISLSEHATRLARTLAPLEGVTLETVAMPIVFGDPQPLPRNSQPHFAVYGNVNGLFLYNVLFAMEQRGLHEQCRFSVISANHFAADHFDWVELVGRRGEFLTRSKMEAAVAPVDFLLLLSDETAYWLTCSGIVYEAIRLGKPAIYFENPCLEQFSPNSRPIGRKVEDFDELLQTIATIIDDFSSMEGEISQYRRNLEALRDEYRLERSVRQLRQVLG